MTTGGGIEHGDDFVAARLSIDVPTEGLASLRELTSEIERFRVNVESANRTGDNFTAYLKASAEAAEHATGAYQNLVAQLQRVSEVQQRISTGAPVAGGGGLDPFAGVQHGRGGAIPTTVVPDASAQIAELNARDPRTYLNMQAARGNLQSGDVGGGSSAEIRQAADQVAARDQAATIQHQQNPPALPTPRGGPDLAGLGGRIGQASGLAQQVMGEMQAGGSMQGMLAAGANIASSAAAAGGVNGAAALSGLSRFAGPVGLGLTAAMAGYGLAQKGGEIVQGYANMGSVRGGGAMEGMGYEASIRAMAMNPFLTTEQSRQIIMGALTEGYSGQTFDSVTKFMASNLTDMNLSVSKSVELLRTNVNEGGQSITGLATDLAILKDLSKDGAMTTPERVANYASTSEALIKAGGVSGPEAGKTARIMGDIWSDSQALKGKAGDIIAQLGSSPGGQMAAYALSGMTPPTGALPGTYFGRDDARDRQATMGLIKKVAAMAQQSSGGDVKNGALLFWRMMKSTAGVDLDRAQAEQMYQRAISGQDPLGASEQQDKAEVAKQVAVQERGTLSQMGGGLVSGAAGVASGMLGAVKFLGQSFGDWMSDDPRKSLGEDWGAYRNNLASHAAAADRAGARYSMPVFDQITKEFGPDGFDIVDASGKAQKLQLNSQKQMEQLSKGDLKFRPKGGSTAYSLSDAVGVTKEDLMSMGPSRVEGTLRVEMDPSTQQAAQQAGLRIPQTIKLTPHERQANMGYGDARPNNAPPGEGTITRGRSGW